MSSAGSLERKRQHVIENRTMVVDPAFRNSLAYGIGLELAAGAGALAVAVGNLWAASYPIKPNLVLDAGFNHGLTSTSTPWEGFAGFIYLLPRRLWRSR